MLLSWNAVSTFAGVSAGIVIHSRLGSGGAVGQLGVVEVPHLSVIVAKGVAVAPYPLAGVPL